MGMGVVPPMEISCRQGLDDLTEWLLDLGPHLCLSADTPPDVPMSSLALCPSQPTILTPHCVCTMHAAAHVLLMSPKDRHP